MEFDKGMWKMKAKIYTKGGDQGETSLVGGARVPKSHQRLNVYGTLDELNSVLGLIAAQNKSFSDGRFCDQVNARLKKVQDNLFNLGSHLACEDEKLLAQLPKANSALISDLEADMDAWENELPELKNFILPGGTPLAAYVHLARTVCRRSEREAVELRKTSSVEADVVIFLNRLSDWLFLLARKFNALAGERDVEWSKS